MTAIKCNSDCLTLTDRTKAIALNLGSDVIHELKYDLKETANKSNDKNSNLDESVFLPCSDISKCGQWFVYSVNKCLLLWKTSDWSLVGCGTLHRSLCKVTFSPSGNNIIVADKGGDVYVFVRDNISKPGTLLLGHFSLLLDVIFTDNEKFIITCDRDEKIRVSCYPNSYNIKSFCLGHDEFVTCLRILPHCQSILVSSSGDGTLKLWDFKIGKELLTYVCSNDVEGDTDVHLKAIRKFESFKIDSMESGACVLFDNYKGCMIYNFKGTNQIIKCSKVQNVKFEKIICDLCMSREMLWIVTAEEKCQMFAYQWSIKHSQFEPLTNNKIKDAIVNVNKFFDKDNSYFKSNFSILYKKEYENIHEYFKRKNERLHESSKRNKIS